jgi:hypothetical protein
MLTAKTFVEPLDMPFSRRGSYICFANANGGSSELGKAQLWISTSRMRPNDRNNGSILADNHFRQIRLELVKDGEIQESVISTTPYELIFECESGCVRFCIGDYKYAKCIGKDGLALRISPLTEGFMSGSSFNLLDGSWKANFGNYFMLFVPERGMLRSAPNGGIDLIPDDEGTIELVMEESLVDPKKRASYMSYDECLAAVKADFDGFARSIAPELPEKYRQRGEQALWTLWGLTVVPDGETVYKRRMIKMIRSSFEAAFSWQQGMHAFFLSGHDLKFAWELLLSCFDYQDSTGRIADSLAYKGPGETMKPPVQGLGFLWLMEHHDLTQLPKEELEYSGERDGKMDEIPSGYRDLDHDGIFEQPQRPPKTGWEAASYFRAGIPACEPDVNAYLSRFRRSPCKARAHDRKSEDVCLYWENNRRNQFRK